MACACTQACTGLLWWRPRPAPRHDPRVRHRRRRGHHRLDPQVLATPQQAVGAARFTAHVCLSHTAVCAAL
eukprot:7379449-Prymnesium_polylepis.1